MNIEPVTAWACVDENGRFRPWCDMYDTLRGAMSAAERYIVTRRVVEVEIRAKKVEA